jgi:GDP-L-fucose synthase
VKFNIDNQLKMLYENIEIQKNVFVNCRKMKVKKIISSLSTCVLPDLSRYSSRLGYIYPMLESDLMVGSPPDSNAGYAYAKRLIQFESNLTNSMDIGTRSVTFTPTNIFGPYDHFSEERSHFIAALIHKVSLLKDGDDLILYGTGHELRQNIYAPDLARMIVKIVEKYEDPETIFLSVEENIKTVDVAKTILKVAGKTNEICFPHKNLAGQFRKDVEISKFKSFYSDFKFTPFEEAIKVTYEWYMENKEIM